jgi:hypothetical protein
MVLAPVCKAERKGEYGKLFENNKEGRLFKGKVDGAV